MAKIEFITLVKLLQIATETAMTNGLDPPSCDEITRMYYQKGKKLQPIIKRCEKGALWVDRYYVAYQINGGDVVYTYIALYHIHEEITAFRAASKLRRVEQRLPKDIRKCFKIARDEMKHTGLPYWIAEPWKEEAVEI